MTIWCRYLHYKMGTPIEQDDGQQANEDGVCDSNVDADDVGANSIFLCVWALDTFDGQVVDFVVVLGELVVLLFILILCH